jgi:hypothetical protein
MPTRKQRRRRAKDRRHEWEYVYVDDSGQEVEVDEAEVEAARPAKPATQAKAKQAGKGSAAKRPSRTIREPLPPSWRRAARRAVPWQVLMIFVVVFLFRNQPIASRVMIAVLYGVAFVPFTYWVDKFAWNRHLKATGRLPEKDKKQKR